jgi:hypothetical protein
MRRACLLALLVPAACVPERATPSDLAMGPEAA